MTKIFTAGDMTERGRKANNRSERGAVLVLTVATVVLVAVLVASLSLTTAVNLRIAENGVADLSNRQAALSALEIAKTLRPGQIVAEDDEPPTEVFSYVLGEARMEIRFLDEEGKINVNRLVDRGGRVDPATREQLERLFRQYIENWEGMVERLADYIDGDTRGTYEIKAKNAPLDTIEELLFIEGITSEMFFGAAGGEKPGLRECLTIESLGLINLNSAPAPVLLSLSDSLSRNDVSAIIQSRTEEPFKRTYDLLEREIIDQQKYNSLGRGLTTRGSHFHTYITTQTGATRKTYEALLAGGGSSVHVVYMRELRK